ncbi:MAG: EAL domain-containing protein [Pseudomonadota bacterium]|nr:EAL domain-containing protein [Pseudomonadota bacterium]
MIKSPPPRAGFRLTTRLLLALYLAIFAHSVPATGDTRIFVLHSYSQEYPWTKSQHSGFIDTYRSANNTPTIISTEYLDTKRKQYTPQYRNEFAGYLEMKYADYRPDLIYVTDDNAADFALKKLVNIFPSAPIIFSGVNNFSLQTVIDRQRMTGVFEKKEISPNLELIRLIEKDSSKIIVVGDGSNTYQAIQTEIKSQLRPHPKINASYVANNRIETLIESLGKVKGKYLILTTIGGMIDKSGRQLTLDETIARIANAGDFVIISMEDAYLKKGVLGGYVTSGRQQGHAAANLALDHQQGKPISQLPIIQDSPNEYVFDYMELKKNRLELPTDILQSASIINKPLSFYQRNRPLILGTIYTLVVLLVLSMTVFLALITLKKREILNQSAVLQRVKDSLTTAQKIAHLGNWEWNLVSDEVRWSDEVYRILGLQPGSCQPGLEKLLSYLPETEREKTRAIIESSVANETPFEIENTLVRPDDSICYVRQVGAIHNDLIDESRVLLGTILDITTIKHNEIQELERLSKLERYQDALYEWSRVDYKDLQQAIEMATDISAHTLGVSRVSIWLFNDDYSEILCQNMYILDQGHTRGQTLKRQEFPVYFKALDTGKMIVANDARNDERTREFLDSYLVVNNIHSMLDTPILYAGKVMGVVCHEHTGTVREWSAQDLEFSSAIASTVSLSLEIQKRREIEKQYEYQAYHDSLTNLPNRTLFHDRLDQAIKLAARSNTRIAILFLDFDNFKEINDSLGHAAGDQVLINIADRLQCNVREADTIARLGGDEFILIMGNFTDTQHIHDVVFKLFNLLKQPITVDNHDIYITSSIGISIYPDDGENTDTLLRNADAAMYKAKDLGRNSFQFYTHDMTERAFERVLMETNLRRALDNHEFEVYYQPQFDADTGQLIGMEALVRWNHPELGMVSPAEFIPAAEETGLIVPIDRWVMQEASRQIVRWYESGLQPGQLAINMAANQLDQADLIETIHNILEASACQPQWLCFEITESQIMKHPEKAISILRKINSLGIELAVDDFGTGYSSLTYLKRLPVDKLKIDQAFIHDAPDDEEDVAIVQAIIALARSLRLRVIAEGVETFAQRDFLLAQGCQQMQGFLYARPMSATDMEQLLRTEAQGD